MIEEPPPPAPEPAPPPPGRAAAFAAAWLERPIRAAGRFLGEGAARAWPGFALGSLAAALFLAAVLGTQIHTGLGLVPDLALTLLLAALLLLVTGGLLAPGAALLGRLPWKFTFGTLGAFAFILALLAFTGAPGGFAFTTALVLVLLAGGLGGGLGALAGGLRQGWRPAAAGAALALLALAGGTLLVLRLAGPGADPWLRAVPPPLAAEPIRAPDPGAPGLWKTATLTYGSGTDRRRPEFGRGAALRTAPVDASKLLPGLKGWKAKVRRWYWGFGKEAFPLDGRVTYPVGAGPFPLVLAVHGNHTAQAFSDDGYRYLGDLLASRGFIFVSVDENFLNGSWEGGIEKENAARAWILLKHLEAWRRWNGEPGNPFTGKVDLDRIALLGHSRGGEAVVLAAAFNRLPCNPEDASLPFDFGFSIRAVAAIAPIDGQYEPAGQPPPLRDVSYLVLQGSHDGDVSFFAGTRPYQRATFSGERPGFKASLWIYRADHAQFNTAWGLQDAGPPLSWLLNRGPLMPGEAQRRIAKVYLSAFLEATLHEREEYVPLFRDPAAGAPWLPNALLVNRFESSAFVPVARYTEGLDLGRCAQTGTALRGEDLAVWRLGEVKGRDEGSFRFGAVRLGWKPGAGLHPAYGLTLGPLPLELSGASRLSFSLADSNEDPDPEGAPRQGRTEPVDFTVELTDEAGTVARLPLSQIRPLQPAFDVRFTKWASLDQAVYKSSWEPVFQTFEIPLVRFKEASPAWSPRSLRRIRFRFDRTPRGLILLDQVGFEP